MFRPLLDGYLLILAAVYWKGFIDRGFLTAADQTRLKKATAMRSRRCPRTCHPPLPRQFRGFRGVSPWDRRETLAFVHKKIPLCNGAFQYIDYLTWPKIRGIFAKTIEPNIQLQSSTNWLLTYHMASSQWTIASGMSWPNRLTLFAMCISVSFFVTTKLVSLTGGIGTNTLWLCWTYWAEMPA